MSRCLSILLKTKSKLRLDNRKINKNKNLYSEEKKKKYEIALSHLKRWGS